MNRLRSVEFRKKAAATTAAILGMTMLAGCGDIYGGSDGPNTVPEATVYKNEGKVIQPALIKIAGQAIRFWHSRKGQEFDPKNDAYELKSGKNDYYLSAHTKRGGRYYDVTVELRRPADPNSAYDVNVNSASDPDSEFGIGFDLSAKPWSASTTNYYTEYKKVKGKTKKKMQTYGDSTDNYMPGIEEVDGYDGYQQEDADQIIKITRQSVRAAEHAVDTALSPKQ